MAFWPYMIIGTLTGWTVELIGWFIERSLRNGYYSRATARYYGKDSNPYPDNPGPGPYTQ